MSDNLFHAVLKTVAFNDAHMDLRFKKVLNANDKCVAIAGKSEREITRILLDEVFSGACNVKEAREAADCLMDYEVYSINTVRKETIIYWPNIKFEDL